MFSDYDVEEGEVKDSSISEPTCIIQFKHISRSKKRKIEHILEENDSSEDEKTPSQHEYYKNFVIDKCAGEKLLLNSLNNDLRELLSPPMYLFFFLFRSIP